ncbi:aspartate-semialdehyde dehydrogenase [Candidatus Palauibacter sp.]|uniref:aspartate-semialdehyde dehydrogenase n=1 Tax=Candidatus Palauibacter sp. TaxID=3101350 RepID=UPI003AF21EA9
MGGSAMSGGVMSGSDGSPTIPVAVLGATGIVGQRLVRMLDGHALFHLEEVVGSERRAGRHYAGATPWAIGGDPPPGAGALRLLAPGEPLRSPLVLSALPAAVAKETELALARSGYVVCTNASAHRMRADTPLIVPEVNGEAISAIAAQPWSRAGGALVANPNCVVVGLAMALAPIQRAFGIESATVVTLQALSGAGLSGLNAVEVAGNVIPGIRGEEEKIGPELNKILEADIEVSVAVNRVPVLDGHTAHVFCKLRTPTTHLDAARVLRDFRPRLEPGSLPTLPARPLAVRTEPDRPQPRLDANAEGGMAVTVGRIRAASPPHDLALVVGVHNGIRGAAGACLANAELCLAHRGAGSLIVRNKDVGDR